MLQAVLWNVTQDHSCNNDYIIIHYKPRKHEIKLYSMNILIEKQKHTLCEVMWQNGWTFSDSFTKYKYCWRFK